MMASGRRLALVTTVVAVIVQDTRIQRSRIESEHEHDGSGERKDGVRKTDRMSTFFQPRMIREIFWWEA
jgi:hypothetical protein